VSLSCCVGRSGEHTGISERLPVGSRESQPPQRPVAMGPRGDGAGEAFAAGERVGLTTHRWKFLVFHVDMVGASVMRTVADSRQLTE
jgi:hypothetical protein